MTQPETSFDEMIRKRGNQAIAEMTSFREKLALIALRMVLTVLTLAIGVFSNSQLGQADEPVNFDRDIRPILSENCFHCHGPDAADRSAELRLDEHDEALKVISPGNHSASELFVRVSSDDEFLRMPPVDSNRSLTEKQIELLGQWIDEGAKWSPHWSLTAIEFPAVPSLANSSELEFENPIDLFIRKRLAEEGLLPSPPADKRTLIRRLSLDLTGLPPTPEQLQEFLDDDSAEAYERLVDRLLSSPHYGERMAWNWLDAARYADSNGYQGDRERTMWPWRDWVVQAFDENLPYDQFTVWQLAGDLLPDPTFEQKLATGFCRNHMINGEGGRIAEENRVDYVMDMTETTGTLWLGLTLNCCRCHDHKFDPLRQKDYYSLFSFFNQTPVTGRGGDPQTAPVLAVPSPEQSQELAQLQSELKAAREQLEQETEELNESDSEEDSSEVEDSNDEASKLVKSLEERIEAVEKRIPKVMVMEDQSEHRKTFLLERGLYTALREEVSADVPESLPPITEEMLSVNGNAETRKADRLTLARWLVSDRNPLMARVVVNRFWQQVFGIGLVKTPEDFGVQGERPSHPELLDWLAADFRDSGWDVKRLMKRMVMSATYRQSSRTTPEMIEVDPQNRLLARGPRYRLPFWMIRDQVLAASGLLVRKQGGPPVNVYQPEGVWEEATFGNKKYKQDHGEDLYRRSLYVFWRRIVGPTFFFDNASRQTCTVKAIRTNTPLQTLLTLNDVTYVEAARVLAEQILTTKTEGDVEKLHQIYERVLIRPPSELETKVLLRGLNRSREEYGDTPELAASLVSIGEAPVHSDLPVVEHASWTALCLAIFNLDETLSKE
ncbi:Planctomycete cytochrome C [Thalassoglobus neptunius]|uniref:Planctomycete cytochrome C n=1 Tax=Thalassoglobus neptunius TaxID=1938619 RepID=A0A5C5VP71_9PLAN|nr:PSD1 and planctomycete cytochrome C domain-containing protein [Thalassoglobus neptunius]TWT39927.1 Planctomycete cytochrome C [Thalassoglobus neptunius]